MGDSRPPATRQRALIFVIIAIISCSSLYSSYRVLYASPLTAHPYVSHDDVWPDTLVAHQRKDPGRRRLSADVIKSQGARRHLKDNLRDDRDYVITMLGAGWNNQILQVVNLIHIGLLSNRVPILPPFRLVHGEEPESIAVSDVFDLDHLSAALDDMPLVELHELKHSFGVPPRLQTIVYDGHVPQQLDGRDLLPGELIPAEMPEIEELGCWSTIGSRGEVAGMTSDIIMDVITPWTPLPRSIYDWEEDQRRPSYRLFADLIRGRDHPAIPPESQAIIRDYNLPQPSSPPDQHVSCIDTTFGFSDQVDRFDVGNEYRVGLGSWARVAQHLRFTKEITEVAQGFAREMLGVRAGAPVPDYVAVHIRRSDFGQAFLDLTPRQYAHATSAVLESLRVRLGKDIKHVICTSDETDPVWLAELDSYGWHVVNHTHFGTAEKYGDWFPILLDSAILSGGTGFLGVVYSTMSLLAYRRTIEWNRGVGRLIQPEHYVPEDWEWPWHVY